MVKRKSVASLKKKADKIFSLYIRHRDSENGLAECITCGVMKPIKEMQNGHFVSRRSSKLRYDEFNCNAQCVGCNMFKQGEQYIYGKNIDRKYGKGTAESLMAQRNETHRFTVSELEEIVEYCKEGLREMDGRLEGLL